MWRFHIKQKKSHTTAAESKTFIYFLMATAMICGAMVMVIEVLGSKVIGPVFGVSLFVWTSLIAVALVALATGYAVGGAYSDRKKSPDSLYLIILAAGLLSMLVPVMKETVLKTCQPLGLRAGSLISSTVLFGPSLFLLGCVSPYIVKIAARELKNIGRTVGVFYAISTVGSFLGTVATGFFLIAFFGVSKIFWFVGLTLICLSAVYFLVFKKQGWCIAVLVMTLFLIPGESVKSRELPGGVRLVEISSMDSFYGSLKIVDSINAARNTQYRVMLLDGIMQSAIDYKSGLSLLDYPYLLQALPYSVSPNGKNALVIGLGAGVIPAWFSEKGIGSDVVDINPQVINAAREHFRFKDSGEVYMTDARFYLEKTEKKYDYIVLDIFLGEITPSHVFSIESFRLIKSRMTEKGVLAVNLLGTLEKGTIVIDSVIKTIRSVFQTADTYRLYAAGDEEPGGNIIVIAYDFSPVPFDPAVFERLSIHPLAQDRIRNLSGKYKPPLNPEAFVLTDEYNPIDHLDLEYKERLRRHIFSKEFIDFIL